MLIKRQPGVMDVQGVVVGTVVVLAIRIVLGDVEEDVRDIVTIAAAIIVIPLAKVIAKEDVHRDARIHVQDAQVVV